MTKEEIKSSILAQLNQQALNTVVDQLAQKVVECEELKSQLTDNAGPKHSD